MNQVLKNVMPFPFLPHSDPVYMPNLYMLNALSCCCVIGWLDICINKLWNSCVCIYKNNSGHI